MKESSMAQVYCATPGKGSYQRLIASLKRGLQYPYSPRFL